MNNYPVHASVSKWEPTLLACGHTVLNRDYNNGVQTWEQWTDMEEHFISLCPTCGQPLRHAPTTYYGKTQPVDA